MLIVGDYVCYDALVKHENETHTLDEWRQIYYAEDCLVDVYKFNNREQAEAFKKGVEAAGHYLSGDFYSAVVQIERIMC